MRLTRIEIENFKGIGKRQVIDLAPITLLFGPNSAGKSTVLQALHYVREILERQNPDPDETIAGGLIDLGGFTSLVHRHELDRAIQIKLVGSLNEGEVNEYLELNTGEFLIDDRFAALPIRYLIGENSDLKDRGVVETVAVEFSVSWSDAHDAPYVDRISFEMDGERTLSIESKPDRGRAILTGFNFKHPLFQQFIDLDDELDEEELDGLASDPSEAPEDPFSSPLGSEVWELSADLSMETSPLAGSEFRVAAWTPFGALPDLDRDLDIALTEVDESEVQDKHSSGAAVQRLTKSAQEEVKRELIGEARRRDALEETLDELVRGPLRILRAHLKATRYVGPLRDIPSRSFSPKASPDEGRWASGLAAWDRLAQPGSERLLRETNAWLADSDRLNIGCQVERLHYREVPVPGAISALFERGLTEDDLGLLQELYQDLAVRTELSLRDLKAGVVVAPADVGVGVSQLVPVVVACLDDYESILAIEQPELHIHPAVQVGLGDLFISAAANADLDTGSTTLLVETHSEHLMLRLLRRIREASEGDIPPCGHSLRPEELSVIYVEATDEAVRFKRLRIDSDGEFIDRWPKGFFEERAEELF
ncbi:MULTISPECIES: DUF3696 domain-containing protein [Maricaulis]|uniref:AAA ATPase-like protein n=1 Tax=Maricaulis maris (strain MCS10) TaxID=394221 RepID=Q0ATC6_MARMM|nr:MULTISPECIES: DUF3696 domain-containing protein [Maricaulis]ABI64461.1 conserved hypothetical protein [Maricaulis maris MCS10]MAC89605.1 hypothetical protein [Maricaulis sp.]